MMCNFMMCNFMMCNVMMRINSTLQLCLSCVAVVSQLCRSCVSVVSQLCRSCVAVVSQLCRSCVFDIRSYHQKMFYLNLFALLSPPPMVINNLVQILSMVC